MRNNVLRDQNISELHQQLTDFLREQFNLRMQKGIGEMPRPHLFKKVRRNIARIKTIIGQKEREGQS